MYGPFLSKIFIGLVDLWTDQRIPDPVSCRCPEPTVGLLETPPRWHATICNPKGRPGGGASSSSKNWKYPYRVECIDENYTLSTHFPYTLIFPIHIKKWTFRRNPLSTYSMKWVNLISLLCVHTTLPFQIPLSTRKFGRAGYSIFSPLGGRHQSFGEIPYLYIARIELLTP